MHQPRVFADSSPAAMRVDCSCGFVSGPHTGTAAEWQAWKAAEQHRHFAQHSPYRSPQHDLLSVRISDEGEYQGFCLCGYKTYRASSPTLITAGLDAHLTEMGVTQ